MTMKFNAFKTTLHSCLKLGLLFSFLFIGCSKIIPIQNENLNSKLPKGKIVKVVTPSRISGFYVSLDSLVKFDKDGGIYDRKTNLLNGKTVDNSTVSIDVDSLYAIKIKMLDYINGVNLKPEQFKTNISLAPTKQYNPVWDKIKVKSSTIKIDTVNNLILGVTQSNNKFNIPLSEIYEINVKQKEIYGVLRVVLTASAVYVLATEARDIFK